MTDLEYQLTKMHIELLKSLSKYRDKFDEFFGVSFANIGVDFDGEWENVFDAFNIPEEGDYYARGYFTELVYQRFDADEITVDELIKELSQSIPVNE